MASLWVALIKLLLFSRQQDWQEFKNARRSIWGRFLTDAQMRSMCSYLLTLWRLLSTFVLLYSTLPCHIFPAINTGILYYLWALLRVTMFSFTLATFKIRPDRLSALPNELLVQILQHANPDLYSLSLVSKQFHSLTEEILYKDVRIVKEPRRGHLHPLLLFMGTILKRDDLKTVVKSLELNSYRMGFENGGERRRETIAMRKKELFILLHCLKNVVSSPHLPARLAWTEELQAGTLDAFVHLLLTWLPNLTSVSLHGYTWNKPNFLTMVTQGAGTSRMFQHLKHLDLRCKVDVHEIRATKLTIQQFAQVLRISSLRSLAVDMVESETAVWPLVDADPAQRSALTALDVSLLHEQNLGRLLHLVPCLQKLTWTFWHNHKRPILPSNMDCAQLQASLSRRSDTLQDLHIIPEHGFYRQWRLSRVTLDGTMNLSAFSRLRTLEIPFNMLVTHQEASNGPVLAERLPTCLEHLVLLDHKKLLQADELRLMILLIALLSAPRFVDRSDHSSLPGPQTALLTRSAVVSFTEDLYS
ncbi:hypothetical protein VTL71DRAFT_15504 [Oculimacula yallundae]|uniref:F-box domain-containing protein n=1 Tax=Oculimacula yallundae TaxID=86028 RepID=A0ABR4CIV7_9HELO